MLMRGRFFRGGWSLVIECVENYFEISEEFGRQNTLIEAIEPSSISRGNLDTLNYKFSILSPNHAATFSKVKSLLNSCEMIYFSDPVC